MRVGHATLTRETMPEGLLRAGDGSMQSGGFLVFGKNANRTMLSLLSLAIHFFKNTLAVQSGFAAALAEASHCVFLE